MTAAHAWVGIDMGMENSFICAIDVTGASLIREPVPTETKAVLETLARLSEHEIQQIAIEAGSTGLHVTRQLIAQGLPVQLYEAQRLSKFLKVRRNKTDLNDALGLAEIARIGWSGKFKVHLKSVETQNIRTILAIRHKVVVQRVAFEGILRSLFRMHGGRLKTTPSVDRFRQNSLDECSRLIAEHNRDISDEIIPLVEMCVQLRCYQNKLTDKVEDIVNSCPVCSRFIAIPGIGPLSALSFYTAIEDPFRFEHTKSVGAYLGLAPKIAQSGKSLAHGRISKRGSRLTRTHLVQSGGVLLLSKRPSALRDWGLAVKERAGWSKARVAVAKKLAMVMLAMWKSGEPYTDRLAPLPKLEITGAADPADA